MFIPPHMTHIIMVSPARVPFPPAAEQKNGKKKMSCGCPIVVGIMGEALIEEKTVVASFPFPFPPPKNLYS